MKLLFFILSLLLLLNGCGSSGSSTTNQLKETSLNNVKVNSTVTLKLSDKKDIKSYSWWSEDGMILGHTSSIRWTAPSKSGRYTITVDTVDEANNSSTESIVINVVDDLTSTNKPVITLNGTKKQDLLVGSEYFELGASANDDEDGSLTDEIITDGDVDTDNAGTYIITYSVTDSDGNRVTQKRTVTVKEDLRIDPRSFTKIKRIIENSKSGKQATFIIAGDSTRAVSKKHNSQVIFSNISRELSKYNVNTILRARGGYRLDQFIDNFEENNDEPSATKVIKDISGEGTNHIVEISLGINDLFALNEYEAGTFDENRDNFKLTIKSRLKDSIKLILTAKPKTTIFLTTPNPLQDWEVATKMMLEVYKEVSLEMKLPLIDFVDALMEGGTKTEPEGNGVGEYDNWYRDGIHFSDYGLSQVSTYILEKILP